MTENRNELLRDFGRRFKLDGDLLTCRACKRSQIASRQDEDFVHRSDCPKMTRGGRPWARLVAILMQPIGGAS